MLATVSPSSLHIDDTLSTLHYAKRAQCIVNKAVVNEDPEGRIIRGMLGYFFVPTHYVLLTTAWWDALLKTRFDKCHPNWHFLKDKCVSDLLWCDSLADFGLLYYCPGFIPSQNWWQKLTNSEGVLKNLQSLTVLWPDKFAHLNICFWRERRRSLNLPSNFLNVILSPQGKASILF